MFKQHLFLVALLFATSISFAQQKDNFDFGLALQNVRPGAMASEYDEPTGGTVGLGLDFFFNRFSITVTATKGNVSSIKIPITDITWSDVMLGYQIFGSKDVKKGLYLLGGYSSVGAQAGNITASISAGFTMGLLAKYKHFYGTVRFNSAAKALGLGIGYAF